VEFEWDESKRQSLIKERSVDLLVAARIFDGPVLTRSDVRSDYGELRSISTGFVDDMCFVVVHTKRMEVTRLITAWKGGQRERTRYQTRDT
jgi:uncharacterized protein